jgi:hypothetical protein
MLNGVGRKRSEPSEKSRKKRVWNLRTYVWFAVIGTITVGLAAFAYKPWKEKYGITS